MRIPLLLLLLLPAAACRSPREEPAHPAGRPEVAARPERPTQQLWENATNRAGSTRYRTLASPEPGTDAMQLTWLGPDRLTFMRGSSESGPARLFHVVRVEGRWSAPLVADLG